MATRPPKVTSGNPSVAAAARKSAAADKAAKDAERAAQAASIKAQFEALELAAPVFDADGFEVIPDRAAEEGGSYKFKVKGQPFILPKLQYLPLSIAQQLGQLSEAQAQELIFGRYTPELLEVATADELMHVMKRWMDYSQGVSLGE